MGGYVKIYGSILGSSIWAESLPTRIVWITMLALADEHGHVEASVSGLARYANVPVAQCRAALVALSEPDTDSKSREFEGRRIANAERGWVILNYLTYREMRSPKQVADAERKAQWRAKSRDGRDLSQESQPIRATVDEAASVAVAVKASSSSAREELLSAVPNRPAWEAVLKGALQGLDGPMLSPEQVERAVTDYVGNGEHAKPNLRHFRAYLRDASRPITTVGGARGGMGQRAFDTTMAALEDVP